MGGEKKAQNSIKSKKNSKDLRHYVRGTRQTVRSKARDSSIFKYYSDSKIVLLYEWVPVLSIYSC